MSFVCRNCAYYGEGDWSQCDQCRLREEKAVAQGAARVAREERDKLVQQLKTERAAGYEEGLAAGRAAERADVLAMLGDWTTAEGAFYGIKHHDSWEDAADLIAKGTHLFVSRFRQWKRDAFKKTLRAAATGTRVPGDRWFDGACLSCGANKTSPHSFSCPFGEKPSAPDPSKAVHWNGGPKSEAAAKPVCDTCKDTHWMPFGEDRHDVMCTRCPTPCQECRAGGNGPYCEKTPCGCACHAARTK